MSTVDISLGLFCLGGGAFILVASLSGNFKSDFDIFVGEIAIALIVAGAVAFVWTSLSTCLAVFRQASMVSEFRPAAPWAGRPRLGRLSCRVSA